MEGPEREAAGSVRGQGCGRQEAVRGREGCLQREFVPPQPLYSDAELIRTPKADAGDDESS